MKAVATDKESEWLSQYSDWLRTGFMRNLDSIPGREITFFFPTTFKHSRSHVVQFNGYRQPVPGGYAGRVISGAKLTFWHRNYFF